MTHVLANRIRRYRGFRRRQVATETRRKRSAQQFSRCQIHLGARLLRGEQGHMVEVHWCWRPPDHLEAVNPVVEGMTRATQDVTSEPGKPVRDNKAAMAILIHGDAAFPTGSRRRDAQSLGTAGYTPGHHSYHHQQPVGFTTLPSDSRSTAMPATWPRVRDSRGACQCR